MQISAGKRPRLRFLPAEISRPETISARKYPPTPVGGRVIAADAAVVAMVRVVVALPPVGATLAGSKEQLAPAGKPPQLAPLKVIVWPNPFIAVIVIVAVPAWPGDTVTEAGLAAMEKSVIFSATADELEAAKVLSPL